MYRKSIIPRKNWETKVEKLGFMYHQTDEGRYWDETAYYGLTDSEIETLRIATDEVYDLYVQALDWLIESNNLALIGIEPQYHALIRKSWQADDLSIIGRFDFRYDGLSSPKLFEFNADTPTSLFEASVVQWDWLNNVFPEKDQFNTIHEMLIASWQEIGNTYAQPFYFTCVKDHLEDLSNTEYLRDTAIQAGIETRFIFVEDIGYDHNQKLWVDIQNRSIETIFKLYPWEWMMNETYGEQLTQTTTHWIEPIWKVAMSSKGMLAILWEMFRGHENLLPTYFENESDRLKSSGYAKKPFFSREGANITLQDGITLAQTEGDYGDEGYVVQELCLLPEFLEENLGYKVKPVIGSWVIGGQSCGIGIRETDTFITDNTSRFIPHLIDVV
jgi:glutathionylspermidine synthase